MLQREGTETHLQPLGRAVVECRPGVGFARLVQASVVGVPGKGVDAPGLEDTGGCDLPVGDQAGFHAQRLRATCRVEIHCNTTVYTGSEKEKSARHRREHNPAAPQPLSPCPRVPSARSGGQGRAGKGSAEAQGHSALAFPRDFLAPGYSLAHSASCRKDARMSPQHSPAREDGEFRQEAEEDACTGEESNAKTSPSDSAAGTAPTQQQDATQALVTPRTHAGPARRPGTGTCRRAGTQEARGKGSG